MCATLLCLLGGCGGGHHGQSALLDPASVPEPSHASKSVALVLAEIDTTETPAGVDQDVFSQLKAELKRALLVRNISKVWYTPPTGEKNRVTDLEVVDSETGEDGLQWSYVNVGDYNQDRLVTISDLTPVGVHFNKTTGAPDWDIASLADGNADGRITVHDITPIGQNFNSWLESYLVERAAGEAGPWTLVCTYAYIPPVGNSRIRFKYQFPEPMPGFYRVIPTDGNSRGEPSNVVYAAAEGEIPNIVAVQPLSGATGSSATFTATVTGREPLVYSWDFDGAATPNTSTDKSPTITLGALGNYPASLTVANDLDGDTHWFTLKVRPGGPEITDVQPQTGEPGSLVKLKATFTAAGLPSFAWDFGGGATPNNSDDLSPTVILAASGDYNASLTVTDEFGADTYEFTLSVMPDLSPQILAVNPGVGYSGSEQEFWANYEVNGTPSFSWDFGGGATPNAISARSPSVVLGAAGEYTGQFTLTDEYGEDTRAFNYRVEESSFAPEIREIWPRAGETGTELTLSARVLGTPPLAYSWNFGGGAIPDTSTEASPTVLLNWPSGVYNASLTVTNSYGEDTRSFSLLVSKAGRLDDTILAIPQTYDSLVDQAVRISVECFNTVGSFYDLKGVRISFNTGCSYESNSFNTGAMGGYRTDADGALWSTIDPNFLMAPSEADLGTIIDLGEERQAIDFWLAPSEGGQIDNATGELFNFLLHINGDALDGDQIEIGIERLGNAGQPQTYFAETDATEHYWTNDDNSSIPPIDVIRPTFELLDPPATGAGTATDPYPVTGGQQLHFKVTTIKWGDVTVDPRTSYILLPLDSGSFADGVLIVGSDHQGILTAQIQFETVKSRWWYFEVPMTYELPADSIVAIPTRTEAYAGEHVGVIVYTNQAAHPFKYVNCIGITLESPTIYVDWSLNAGDPGGGNTADGVWADVTSGPVGAVGIFYGADIRGGRKRYDINITPGGSQIDNATGAVLYFEIEIASNVHLGFQEFYGVKRTYYSDDSLTEYYWGDVSNDHPGVPNSIMMLPSS